MSNLDAALAEPAEALEACSIPYILIGGLAVAAWGEPRSTLDVDLSVWADPEALPDAVACLCGRLRSLTSQPLAFVEKSRVLPLESRAGIRLDIRSRAASAVSGDAQPCIFRAASHRACRGIISA